MLNFEKILNSNYTIKTTKHKTGEYTSTLFHNKKTAGIILFIVNEAGIYINSVNVNKAYRGKGVGTFLILYSFCYFKYIYCEKYNIQDIDDILVYLDDMSDNAWKENNLYIQLGFKYEDEYPLPEMSSTIGVVSSIENYEKFIEKYCESNEIFILSPLL